MMNGLFLIVGLFPTDRFQLENNKPPVPAEQFAYKWAAASSLKVPSGTQSQRHARAVDVHKSHQQIGGTGMTVNALGLMHYLFAY